MRLKTILQLICIISLLTWICNIRSYAEEPQFKSNFKSTNQEALNKWNKKIDEIVEPAFKSKRVMGMVIGIWDGNSASYFGYGKIDLKGEAVPDEKTIFEIGSITKVFTSLLLAKRIIDNKVTLNDPVEKLLPKYFKIPQKQEKQITLLHLATHFSGLPKVPSNMRPKHVTNPYKNYTAYNLREFLTSYQLPREPGEKWEYSNLGVGLLGFSLGAQSGTTYRRLIFKEITGPMELKDTRFQLNEEQSTRFAKGFTADLEKADHWDFDVLAPAGGLRSTASDMLRFATTLLKDNGQFSTVMQMTTKSYGKTEIPDNDMGLGWLIAKKQGHEVFWHNGGTGGFSSFLAINKEKNIAVIVLSNTATTHSGVVDDIGGSILKCLLGLPYETPKWPIEADIKDDNIDKYTGDYELISSKDVQGKPEDADKIVFNVKRKGNRLVIHTDKKVKISLYPQSENVFFAKIVPMTVTFSEDTKEKTILMNISSHGEESAWRRISPGREIKR